MSQPWKLLPLAAIVAVIGALLLTPGGVTQPNTASAELDCTGLEGNLVIQIFDDDDDELIDVEGARIEVEPDPYDAVGSDDFNDGGSADADNVAGQITLEDVCADDDEGDPGEYVVTLISLPDALEDCDINDDQDSDLAPLDNDDLTLVLEVDCSNIATATPTATATGTPGDAATVTTSASPSTITCSGTSIVTIQVRDEDGDPVPAGTTVEISTTIGSVSPSTGQTTDASGNAFVFLTAPANEGGKAVVTAESGDAEGSTNVTINCGTVSPTATTAPPPTVSTGGGGVISPPNTGNAGLAADTTGTSWVAFAGIGLLAAAALGAVGIAKVRA